MPSLERVSGGNFCQFKMLMTFSIQILCPKIRPAGMLLQGTRECENVCECLSVRQCVAGVCVYEGICVCL